MSVMKQGGNTQRGISLQGFSGRHDGIQRFRFVLFGLVLISLVGCTEPSSLASGLRQGAGQPDKGGGRRGQKGESNNDNPAVVEILQASTALDEGQTYTGTTEPQQQVALRAQMAAQLLDLSVDIGDRVTQGQTIGQLDGALVQAAVQAAEAELAGRQSLVAQARAELLELQAAIDEAKAEQEQARVDAQRLRGLATEGAISQQQAELAETALRVAQQQVRSAQEQFRAQEQAIATAQQQVSAQRAVLVQVEKQQSFATLAAPMTGVVLARQVEPGDFLQAGQEILTIGDLLDLQVVIEITDQRRGQIAVGQTVRVQLDALPNQPLRGSILQISPVADPDSRLIPVEIALDTSTLDRPDALGSGLLARVTLASEGGASALVSETAIAVGGDGGHSSRTRLFVLEEAGDELKAVARSVQLGANRNGQIEVLDGLVPGDRYIAKSDRPLQDGQVVQRSLASEL